jgi:hypothetical protein
MTTTSKRYVWLPVLLTIVCGVSYLAPTPAALLPLNLHRVSGIGAPGFVVFLQLSGVTDLLPISFSPQQVIKSALLIVVLLSWFTFILLPFWSDFRVVRLSLRNSRFLFAFLGVVITVFCWLQLGGWRTIDE